MKPSFINNFKCGRKIIYNSEPYVIEYSEFIKPGKGRAFVRLKLRRLLHGTLISKTFKSSKSFLSADILKYKFVYLYNDNKYWYFMNPKNLKQVFVKKKIILNNIQWLSPKDNCEILFWNNKPISVILKNFIKLRVIKSINTIEKNTLLSCNKIVKLTTSAEIKVPLFIQPGDIIKIDTRTGTYVSRVKSNF